MIMKKLQRILFLSNIKKISKLYGLPFLLSLWGIGNVFYWEVYKGYKACTFCKWHRGLYFSLFIGLILLFKYRKYIFKFLILIIIAMESVVGGIQVFGWICNPMICRRVSFIEKLNFSFAVSSLILLISFELFNYIKAKNSKNS